MASVTGSPHSHCPIAEALIEDKVVPTGRGSIKLRLAELGGFEFPMHKYTPVACPQIAQNPPEKKRVRLVLHPDPVVVLIAPVVVPVVVLSVVPVVVAAVVVPVVAAAVEEIPVVEEVPVVLQLPHRNVS